MARLPDLLDFSRHHGLRIGTIADLIQHRSATESLVERLHRLPVQTPVRARSTWPPTGTSRAASRTSR